METIRCSITTPIDLDTDVLMIGFAWSFDRSEDTVFTPGSVLFRTLRKLLDECLEDEAWRVEAERELLQKLAEWNRDELDLGRVCAEAGPEDTDTSEFYSIALQRVW